MPNFMMKKKKFMFHNLMIKIEDYHYYFNMKKQIVTFQTHYSSHNDKSSMSRTLPNQVHPSSNKT